MSVDLAQFIPGFLAESQEGLEVMESSLLSLAPGDSERIDEVFRAAHSIKGGAGTFGFTGVAEFTHQAETLLDAMRNGSAEVSPERVQLLLQSVDCIRDLLERAGEGDHALPSDAQALAASLAGALGVEDEASEASGTGEGEVAAPGNASLPWQISLVPDPGFLMTGNDPLFLLAAMEEMGTLQRQVDSDKLPPLAELEPEQLHLRWQLSLSSDCSEAEIRDLFAWVEDEVELEIGRAEETASGSGWQGRLQPEADLLMTGNDPLFLFRALADIGPLEVQADSEHLPSLAEFDPEQLYLSWRFELDSNCDESSIREVFEWVEDSVALELLSATAEPVATEAAEMAPQTAEIGSAADPAVSVPPAMEAAGAEISAPRSISRENPAHQTSARQASARQSGARKAESSIRVDTGKVDALVDRVGELVITQAMLQEISQALEELEHPAIENLHKGLLQLERNTRELQEDVMRIRMLPISFVFNRFPRLVHDVSQQLGKQVELHLSGEQTELDKTVLEKIGDPLVHLIRNGLDHGLETPDERMAGGKSASGHLWLSAAQQGGSILIEIRDDGRGLNRSRILSRAQERGLVSADASLSDTEIDELIFLPGFSTAEQVSDLSGRGVGMDVVRRNIESLGGGIEVHSVQGSGSRFTIRLPLTLAIMDGQLVRLDSDSYVIPLTSIVETLQAREEMLVSLAGNRCMLHFRDEYIPLLPLSAMFGLAAPRSLEAGSLVVVVENNGHKAGLVVDELMGQQQTVIKSLEKNFKRVQGISGATILGDGTVALILDVACLVSKGVDADLTLLARQYNQQREAQGRDGN